MRSAQNGIPLPPLSTVTFDEQGLSVWAFLLSAEKAAYISASTHDNLVGSRVLGHLLSDLWDHRHLSLGAAPYRHLCFEIECCIGMTGALVGSEEETRIHHNNLWALGVAYRNNIIRFFRSNAAAQIHIPPSDDPPQSFDEHRESTLTRQQSTISLPPEMAIRASPISNSDAKNIALIRDGYRCMLSGAIDLSTACRYDEVADLPGATSSTKAVPLFPRSAEEMNEEQAPAALAILKLFRLDAEIESILDYEVNNPRNILTLEYSLCRMFNRFDLWLEEVAVKPNTYDVIVAPAKRHRYSTLTFRLPSRIEFTVAEKVLQECKELDILPPALPDSRLIALRASCSRIVQLSGAAEQIDEMD
ncbi:hypothetical protein DL96DRAFT_1631437 [Flagelloscypha sp. PMI_526]|nr:hypothetical protein DL96DRAFT_1631437 [Flagelloscypha sp. PMI_526]